MTTETSNPANLRKQRIKLVFIFSLFALPVVIAWIWHANSDQWRPSSTTNYGELITPARPIENFSVPDLNGQVITQDYLQGRWTLVYIGGADCDSVCISNLYNIRQIRIALNEKIDRVQRLWIVTGVQDSPQLAGLLSEHPGLQVVKPDITAQQKMLAQFKVISPDSAVEGRVYLIDPLGNLMMRYPASANPKSMLKDIERLLKTSWIG